MVEIFKTNVQNEEEVGVIVGLLLEHYPEYVINFDLEDRDRILRIEAFESVSENVRDLLEISGVFCEEIL